jgi:signal transduction histidine kinase
MITLSEGAAAQSEAASDLAPDAMRRVAETGRESLAEMRRLLGVLRAPGDSAELAPQPGADSIGSLIAQFREAGLPVAWRHDGAAIPRGGVGLAAYRIVQESLTNVLRHAPGTRRVDVATRNDGSVVSLTIDNETTYDPMPSDGSGRGLVGMRERAAMHAGSVAVGPRSDGRWRVHATLNIDAPSGEQ